MSLDNTDVVDAVGTETKDDTIVLSIIDGWDWTDEQRHLQALQHKLNAYFIFVESGEIFLSYPEAIGHVVRVDIIGKFPIPDIGLAFLKKATIVAAELNMLVTHRLH